MSDWANAEQSTLLELLDRRLGRDPDGPFLDCCGTPYTAAEMDRARDSGRLPPGATPPRPRDSPSPPT